MLNSQTYESLSDNRDSLIYPAPKALQPSIYSRSRSQDNHDVNVANSCSMARFVAEGELLDHQFPSICLAIDEAQ